MVRVWIVKRDCSYHPAAVCRAGRHRKTLARTARTQVDCIMICVVYSANSSSEIMPVEIICSLSSAW